MLLSGKYNLIVDLNEDDEANVADIDLVLI